MIRLKKWHGELAAFLDGWRGTFRIDQPALMPMPSIVLGLCLMLLPALVLVGAGALLLTHLSPDAGLAGFALMGAIEPNISKNRAANELRAKARAIMAEIEDTSTPLTGEQFDAKKKEFDALTTRAQFIAEHTPEKEIERQGGEGDLVRVASVEEADVTPPSYRDQLTALHGKVRAAFGGTANYIRAMRGTLSATTKQTAVLQEARRLTAAIIPPDERTTRTIVGTASDASGGEFLLPLEQEQSIFQIDNAIPGLLDRCALYSMRGRTKRIPYLIQDNNEVTRPLSGIAAIAIVGEGSTKGTREPTFGERILTAYKYAAISKFSDEMLDDDLSGDIDGTVVRKVGQEILNQINFDVTISGTGSSQPTGALYTSQGALLKVTRATQNRITFADALNMYVAHTHGPNCFWMVGRAAFAQLPLFELSTGSSSVFVQTLNMDPRNARLLGYPIVITDFLNALGSEGDFALVNPDHYAAALRKQLTVESSIHVGFVDDVTTWRFFARGGGLPIPTEPYAYRSVASSNVDQHSPFVVLDDVYV